MLCGAKCTRCSRAVAWRRSRAALRPSLVRAEERRAVDTPPPAEDTTDLVALTRSLSAALASFEVTEARQRVIVLGPNTDLAAVKLFIAALKDGVQPPREERYRLRRALDALQATLDANQEEAEYYKQQQGKVSSQLLDGSSLTDAEKIGLSSTISSGLIFGAQGAIWSSFFLLLGGIVIVIYSSVTKTD